MGGKQNKETEESNTKDKRRILTDRILWEAIIELTETHQDEFPFSSREVALQAGKTSGSAITRERGGLIQFLYDSRGEFREGLTKLVEDEKTRHGEISSGFTRNLTFLIADHYYLFVLDVISDSFRNTRIILNLVKPLIEKRQFHHFGAELYILLSEWYEERFAREYILIYEKRLSNLFIKYQNVRPDMNIMKHLAEIDDELQRSDNNKSDYKGESQDGE